MTTFDESKHNRHSDGKFANKPHAEAEGVTLDGDNALASKLLALPAQEQAEALAGLRAAHMQRWAEDNRWGSYPWPDDLDTPQVELQVPMDGDEGISVAVSATFNGVTARMSGDGYYEGLTWWEPEDDHSGGGEDQAQYLGITPDQQDMIETVLAGAYEAGWDVAGRWGPLQDDASSDVATAHAFKGIAPTPKLVESPLTAGATIKQRDVAEEALAAAATTREYGDDAPKWDADNGPAPTDLRVTWKPGNSLTHVTGRFDGEDFEAEVLDPYGETQFRWVFPASEAREEALEEYLSEVGGRASQIGWEFGPWQGDGAYRDAATRAATGQ